MTYDEQLASASADYYDGHNDPDGGDEPDWYAPIAAAYAVLRDAQVKYGDCSAEARAARVEIERSWVAWYGGESVNQRVNPPMVA